MCRKIFHTTESCKVFTLEFSFLNSLSQGSIWFGKPSQLGWKCAFLLLEVAGSILQRLRGSEPSLLSTNSVSIKFCSYSSHWQMWDSISNNSLGSIADHLFSYHMCLESSLCLRLFIDVCPKLAPLVFAHSLVWSASIMGEHLDPTAESPYVTTVLLGESAFCTTKCAFKHMSILISIQPYLSFNIQSPNTHFL